MAQDLRELITNKKKGHSREDDNDDGVTIETLERWIAELESGLPIHKYSDHGTYCNWYVSNAYLSECYVCKKASLWVAGRVIFPAHEFEVSSPNEDLPSDIASDYAEAADVLQRSPRSAAALLRLAIQKLCLHLLERDRGDINDMIGELVGKGLSVLVQRALDVVRVIGNEAVHPGTIDLRDDHDVAIQLFTLVNLIAEAMISQPKHVMALYGALPSQKLEAIERRDAPAKAKAASPNAETTRE